MRTPREAFVVDVLSFIRSIVETEKVKRDDVCFFDNKKPHLM